MKLSIFTLAGALLLSFQLAAQNKQFTMEEAVLGLRRQLAPKNLKQLQWLPGSNNYVYLDDSAQCFVRTRVPDMKTDTLLRLASINEVLKTDPLKKMPSITWGSEGMFYFQKGNYLYKGIANSNRWYLNVIDSFPENADNITISNNLWQITYNIDKNLYLIDKNNMLHRVTNEGNKEIISGRAVHRNEFGIETGIFFSPEGNLLAFYQMDQGMVADYPVIDWSKTPAVNENIKYPMSGGTSHQVKIGVYNPETKSTVFLQTGEPLDHYLTCVTWSPDEKNIYVAVLNREQNHVWLNKYDAQTGIWIKTLFEETDPKYVEPQHALEFIPNSDNEFLWWSQRDGYMQLFRYDTGGKLLNKVTKGDWLVNEIKGFNIAKKEIILTTNTTSPLDKNVVKVNWKTGEMTQMDESPGIHNIQVSEDGQYVMSTLQNSITPRSIDIISADKKFRKNILAADNPLTGYQLPRVDTVSLKAGDGTTLYGKLIYPANFDPAKKYPVIVYLYNGPHVQLIQNGFPASGNLWYDYMAQHGYVVFTMDGRGSGNRGTKFEQATFRQLGTVEMNDQLAGVEYLRSLPFVDAGRMGVHGWSFGGFMTTSLMLRHPDVFKCAVAGGPVLDWSMYEIMYTERYMDTPEENPKGYEENNLLTKTKNLKGKLLMIHGAQDDVVVWQHSMKFIKACVDNGVQLDYFVYPGHPHNVMGKDRVHLMQKITDYFDQYLKN